MSLNFYRPGSVRNGRTAKFLVGFFVFSFVSSMTLQPLIFNVSADHDTGAPYEGEILGANNTTGATIDKIRICHATGSLDNPYTNPDVNINSFFSGGHDTDLDDIIPPFHYDLGNDLDEPVESFTGMNWEDDFISIWENDCEEVTPTPTPTVTPTPTSTPTPEPTSTPTPTPEPSPTPTPEPTPTPTPTPEPTPEPTPTPTPTPTPEPTPEPTPTPLGKLSGYKWNDIDGNGEWDLDESALSGWTIRLNGDSSYVTDENGYYEFTDLGTNDYYVCEELQEGWNQTYPNSNTEGTPNYDIYEDCDYDYGDGYAKYGYFVQIDGDEVSGLNFGNQEIPEPTPTPAPSPTPEPCDNELNDCSPPVSQFDGNPYRDHETIIDVELLPLTLSGTSTDDTSDNPSGVQSVELRIFKMADEHLVDSEQYGVYFESLNCVQRGDVIETEIIALSLGSADPLPLNVTWAHPWMPTSRGVYCIEAHATDAAGNVENTAFGGPISILVLPTPTPTPTPAPTPTPEPSCTSNCGGGGGGGGGGIGPFINAPTPTPSSAPAPSVAPEVLGAITTLPETSLPMADRMLFSIFTAMLATGVMMLMLGYGLTPSVLKKYLD